MCSSRDLSVSVPRCGYQRSPDSPLVIGAARSATLASDGSRAVAVMGALSRRALISGSLLSIIIKRQPEPGYSGPISTEEAMPYFHKRYHLPGTPPGTLTRHVVPKPVPPHISLIEYGADRVEELHDVTPEQCKSYLSSTTLTWIHVSGHTEPEVLHQLGGIFGLHPLAMEDVLNTGQRPKVETYDSQLFVIASLPLFRNDRIEVEQVSLFAGKNYVVSFYAGPDDPFEPVRQRLRNRAGPFLMRTSDYLLYALLDVVIDQGFPVLERFGEIIEALETDLLESPDKDTLNNLHEIKRELLLLRRMLWPQREILSHLMHDVSSLIHSETQPYLRDCYDHTIQIMDLLETYRDMTASMLDVYLSSISNRLNETMRILTVIATLFIPPTFIAGVYGMNFHNPDSPWSMPELGWYYGYPFAWAIMLAMIVGMLAYFRRKKWL